MQSIGEAAFSGSGLTTIEIPDTVTSIGAYAFKSCEKLTSLTIPNSVTSIGDFAFADCSVLSEVILSESLTAIGDNAFQGCKELTGLTIPNTVKSLGSGVFSDCTKLESITLSTQLKTINRNLFWNCENLSHIDIPDGVGTIDTYAFEYCKALQRVRFPESLKTVAEGAFRYAAALDGVTLPEGTQTLGASAFSGCSGMTQIVLPDSITAIGDSCFADTGLTTIQWPTGTTKVAASVLAGSSNLSKVILHDQIKSIEEYAFSGCEGLGGITIPASMTAIKANAFNGSGLVSISIPETILSVGEMAFSNCQKLARVQFSNPKTSIGNGAFSYCILLSSIDLPAELTRISSSTFQSCYELRSIVIPETVTVIDQSAFEGCYDLTSINIPGSVQAIGRLAFNGCGNLKTLRIPGTVLSIGDNAFAGCYELTIYGEAGSAAQTAAAEYDYVNFVIGGQGGETEENLTGRFTEKSVTIALGEKLTPSGLVESEGSDIYRVTLTINDWNQDGTNANRYRSQVVEDRASRSINLMDLEDFYLDTTVEPLNVPGEYTINLWASLEEGGGVKLDSMTVKVEGASPNTISGLITLKSGESVPNVDIYIYDMSNYLVGYTSSNSQGKWTIDGLTEGNEYYIYYGHSSYAVSDNGNKITAGTYVNSIASVNGETNNELCFTMKQGDTVIPNGGSISVGTAVEFTVSAPGATVVKLLVDEKNYSGDEYDVTDGVATFARTFTKAGSRKIQFQAYISGQWELQDGFGTLEVTKSDDLRKPEVKISGNGYTGDSVTFEIETIDHAENYYVKVYKVDSGITIYQKHFSAEELQQMEYTLDVSGESFLDSGEYCISIIVTGTHYSQNDAQKTFTISKHGYTVQLTMVGDSIEISAGESIEFLLTQTEGAYSTIVVSGNETMIYYPQNDQHIISETSHRESILFAEPGTYQIQAYVYASNLNPEINVAENHSEAITVCVTENLDIMPAIISHHLEKENSYYTWIDDNDPAKLYVTTNSVVDDVYVSLNGAEEVRATKVSNDRDVYVADLSLNEAGLQLAVINAVDYDAIDEKGEYRNDVDTKNFYYVVNVTDKYYVYPNVSDVVIRSSPIAGDYLATEKGGEWFEHLQVIAEAGDWKRVQTNAGVIGFVSQEAVTMGTPASGNGKIEMLIPSAGQKLSVDNELQISWRAGIGGISSASLKMKNINTQETTIIPLTGYYQSKADISSVKPGNYQLSVVLSIGGNTRTRALGSIESTPIECIIGNFDQDLVDKLTYTIWFNDHIFTPYMAYMLRYRDVPNSNEVPTALWEAVNATRVGSTVSTGGILFNNETETMWSSADEAQQKKIDLIIIGDIVKNDARKEYVALNRQYTTVKESILASAKSAQSLSQIDNNIKLFSAGGEAIKLTLKTHKVLKDISDESVKKVITNNGKYATAFTTALDLFIKKYDDILDVLWESTAEAVLDLSREYDSLQISCAYKRDYATSLKETSEAYIEAFEEAIFGGVGKAAGKDEREMTRLEISAKVYINAFNELKNSNDEFMESNALSELADYSNKQYTDAEIEKMHDDYWLFMKEYLTTPQNWKPLLENGLRKYIEVSFKNDFKDMEEFKGIPSQIIETFIKEDIPAIVSSLIELQNDGTIFSIDNMIDTTIDRLKARAVTLTAAAAVPVMIGIFKVIAAAGSVNVLDKVAVLGKVKEICEKANQQIKGLPIGTVINVVLQIGRSAWKTGTKISKAIQSAQEFRSQMKGKTEFECYAAYMADSYSMALKIAAENELSTMDTLNLLFDLRSASRSIKELEKIRIALISLSSTDEMSMAYLLSMRTINELAEWRYTLQNNQTSGLFRPEDYPDEDKIKEEISMIRSFRKNIMNVPANIQAIIDRQ